MNLTVRRLISPPAFAFAGTLLWGLVELFALARTRWVARLPRR